MHFIRHTRLHDEVSFMGPSLPMKVAQSSNKFWPPHIGLTTLIALATTAINHQALSVSHRAELLPVN